MTIQENISLASYTTFKIGGPARFFCLVKNKDELREAVQYAKQRKLRSFVLGGGSNILMNDSGFEGVVIKMEIGGISVPSTENREPRTGTGVVVSVGAGVQWDSFVEYAVEHGLFGIENLSAIPGTVGAAPVQNIGAYGAEVGKHIQSVRAYDTKTDSFVELMNAQCHFSYRDSIFKKEKGRYIITRVDFRLEKDGAVDISYKDVSDYFSNKDIKDPSLREVRDAVIDIRRTKLPDWKKWGTAGSFFKNPIIRTAHYERIREKYPDLPSYPEGNDLVKVSLGWILDKVCGLKGYCANNVCVYDKQALVLVAKPGATAEDVVRLARMIIETVKDKTGIDIEAEVEWVN